MTGADTDAEKNIIADPVVHACRLQWHWLFDGGCCWLWGLSDTLAQPTRGIMMYKSFPMCFSLKNLLAIWHGVCCHRRASFHTNGKRSCTCNGTPLLTVPPLALVVKHIHDHICNRHDSRRPMAPISLAILIRVRTVLAMSSLLSSTRRDE